MTLKSLWLGQTLKTDIAHLLAQRDCEWMFPANRIKKRGKKVSQSFEQLRIYNSVFLSRIHKRTISLRFLSIILKVLRLVVSVSMFTLQTSFKSLLLKGGGGVKSGSRGDCE
jgi:hypothetical protein